MKKLIVLFFFCFLLIGNIFAQKNEPKFSSVYTDMKKGCKTAGGQNGTDPSYDCRGVGGYRIHNWSAAAAQFLAVTPAKSEEPIQLATLGFDFDHMKVKVEWRMANGKPFAVILRIPKYGETDENNPYIGKKIGEQLIIKGLKGFEKN